MKIYRDKIYDYVFITHLPSFYKVNLYKALASSGLNVAAIFISSGSVIRQGDFVSSLNGSGVDYVFLNKNGDFESRNAVLSLFNLIKVISSCRYKNILVGGWDLIEFWVALAISPKAKNAVVVESTIFENNGTTSFLKKFLKRIFLSRVYAAFPSGSPHNSLLDALGYQGLRIVTGGVGLINRPAVARSKSMARMTSRGMAALHLVYVGRLSKEKNLEFLCRVISRRDDYVLTVVGDGPLKPYLQALCSDNVSFVGYLNNSEALATLAGADALVLPSVSETWGLVVEEAMALGVPCLVSNRVGSAIDLVLAHNVGLTFDPYDDESLMQVLDRFSNGRQTYSDNSSHISYDILAEAQIAAYVQHANSKGCTGSSLGKRMENF